MTGPLYIILQRLIVRLQRFLTLGMKFALPAPETLRRSGRTRAVKTKDWPPACPSGRCSETKGCVCHGLAGLHGRPSAHYLECTKIIYGEDAPGMPIPSEKPPAKYQGRLDAVFKATRRSDQFTQPSQQCRTIKKSRKRCYRARAGKAAMGLVWDNGPDSNAEQTFNEVLGDALASDLDDALDQVLEYVLPTPLSDAPSHPKPQENDPLQGVICLSDAPVIDAFNAQWIFSQEEIDSGLAPQAEPKPPEDPRTWDEILHCDEPPLEPEPAAAPEVATPVAAAVAAPVAVTLAVAMPLPPKTPPPVVAAVVKGRAIQAKQAMLTLAPAPISMWV